MPRFTVPKRALAGLMLFGAQPFAQAQTVSSTTPGITLTTAIVGVTGTQSARLNVLSLQPVIPGVTAVACPATLEFYDDTGALLKQLAVTNISPATAAALAFKPTVPSAGANARANPRRGLHANIHIHRRQSRFRSDADADPSDGHKL